MPQGEKPRLGIQELEALHELAVELGRLDDYEPMLDTLVRRALELLRAERGLLVLRRGETDELEFKVVRNWRREELEGGIEHVSQTILAHVLRHGEPMLIKDALTDELFAGHRSVVELQIRSVLAAPLEVEGRIAGVLYLESCSPTRLFRAEDLELFKRIVALASRAVQTCMKRLVLEQRVAVLERDFMARYNFQGIVTRDPQFLQVLETVAQVAPADIPVLVQGPSGSGKELIARALHLNSGRANGPFLVVNCAAIPASLLESELFGHVRGAFTGATSDKQGFLPQAHGGTIVLDEIGEMSKDLQVKLLRVLQFGEIHPVGAAKAQRVNVRFVAATNRNLEEEVREGRFREDLLFRLNAVTLDLPPLHERPDDILPLFYHCAERAARQAGKPVPKVTPRLERVLQKYAWPGNVRELENEAHRLVALTPPGEPLAVDRLSKRIAEGVLVHPATAGSLARRERELIELHLRLAGANRSRAARALGISREALRQKMKRYKLK